jgi:hypothetical protein
VLSAIGLALDFQTWRAMVCTQGLSDEQAIELMVGMVRCWRRTRVGPDLDLIPRTSENSPSTSLGG